MFNEIKQLAFSKNLIYESINPRPQGYKTFFMLNSTEHEISTARNKLKYQPIKNFLALSLSDGVFIMLINVKMPTIVGILTFMIRMNFMLSRVEYEKSQATKAQVSMPKCADLPELPLLAYTKYG